MLARLALLWVFALMLAAGAAPPPPEAGVPAVRTGKERLGAKWADDQRVDDCKVPQALRDPDRPRPGCAKKGKTE